MFSHFNKTRLFAPYSFIFLLNRFVDDIDNFFLDTLINLSLLISGLCVWGHKDWKTRYFLMWDLVLLIIIGLFQFSFLSYFAWNLSSYISKSALQNMSQSCPIFTTKESDPSKTPVRQLSDNLDSYNSSLTIFLFLTFSSLQVIFQPTVQVIVSKCKTDSCIPLSKTELATWSSSSPHIFVSLTGIHRSLNCRCLEDLTLQ